jgi:hypothetical protein
LTAALSKFGLLIALLWCRARAVHGTGTFQTWRSYLVMSVVGGKAENICSIRVIPVLTDAVEKSLAIIGFAIWGAISAYSWLGVAA